MAVAQPTMVKASLLAYLLDLSPLSTGCGVDLRKVWRLCIDRRGVICYCSSNNLAHTDAP
jgi:hypothetical protein